MASVAYDVINKIAPVLAEHLAFENATTTQNELYGDTNLDHLNWLERAWASYYIWMGNAIVATGVLSFVLHEVGPSFSARYPTTCLPVSRLSTLAVPSHG